jgi:hypothetical protein
MEAENPQQAQMNAEMNAANAFIQQQAGLIAGLNHQVAADAAAAQAATAAAAQATTAAVAAAHAQHAPQGNMPRGYRPEGPPKYYGKQGEDLEAWLFQLEESNRLFPITDELQRIRYTALFLRETAAKWYASMQMADPPQIVDWESFTTKLKQQFVHMDQKWLARNQMFSLKQVGNVRDYSVRFRNLLILIPDMSAPDALDKYIRGLKDFAWKVWRRKFLTLEEAMLYAEELDLEVQQKHVVRRSYYEAGPDERNYNSPSLSLAGTARTT